MGLDTTMAALRAAGLTMHDRREDGFIHGTGVLVRLFVSVDASEMTMVGIGATDVDPAFTLDLLGARALRDELSAVLDACPAPTEPPGLDEAIGALERIIEAGRPPEAA